MEQSRSTTSLHTQCTWEAWEVATTSLMRGRRKTANGIISMTVVSLKFDASKRNKNELEHTSYFTSDGTNVRSNGANPLTRERRPSIVTPHSRHMKARWQKAPCIAAMPRRSHDE